MRMRGRHVTRKVHLKTAAVVTVGLVTSVLFALRPTTSTADPPPDPLTCAGYSEPRAFIEVQQWWQPTISGTEDFGHVHLGACFPRPGTHVSGTVHFDFVVKLHDNPGVLHFVRIHVLDGAGRNTQAVRVNVNQTCPTPDCTYVVPADLNTNVAATDGYANFRAAAIVMHPESGGTKSFAGAAWPLYIDNGKRVRDAISPLRLAGSSWYTGALYNEAEFLSPLPDAPVSGVWTPSVAMRPGAGGRTGFRHAFASVDPSFHASPPSDGFVVLDQQGQFIGKLSIDTTQLTNGPHKLFLRSDAPCDGTKGNDCGKKPNGTSNNVSTHSSAEVIPFVVQN